jgi:DNA (cytosine-5)-methyltransferase 1
VTSKPKFKASKHISSPELYDYYLRFYYDFHDHSYQFPPSYDLAKVHTQLFERSQPRRINVKTKTKEYEGKEVFKSFQFAGETYSLGDFVYVHPKEGSMFQTYIIGKIIEISKYQGKDLVRIQKYERPWDLGKNHKDASTDLKEVFWTKTKFFCPLFEVDKKCFVYHKKNIENFEKFLKLDDHFYFQQKFEKQVFSDADKSEDSQPTWKPPADVELTAFDVFAGCGGLSTGTEMAGIKTKWACERNSAAGKIFKENHPDCHLFSEDVNELLTRMLTENEDPNLPKEGDVDLLQGGPPCQGFSGINRFQKFQDPLNMLFIPFLGLVEHLKPRFVVVENVAGMFRHSKGVIPKIVMSTFLALGYQINVALLTSYDYSLPQWRKRVIFLAAKHGEKLPNFPTALTLSPTMFDEIDKNVPNIAKKVQKKFKFAPFPAIIGEDALSDLPPLESGESMKPRDFDQKPKTPWQVLIRNGAQKLYNHETKRVIPENLERIESIPKLNEGSSTGKYYWKDMPKKLVPICLPHNANKHNGWRGLFGRISYEHGIPTILTGSK